jgi:hypothetical protein
MTNSWDELLDNEREAATLGEAAVRQLKKHESIDRWHDAGKALVTLQTAAMRLAHTNQPQGPRYRAKWQELSDHVPHLRDLDKGSRSDACWLANEWEAVNAWLQTLVYPERWRLNHPTSIHRRWKATHAAPGGEEAGTSPAAGYKQRAAELEAENAELRQQLKRAQDDGSLFNLERDTGEQIGRVIGNSVGETKAAAIAKAIQAAVKAKRTRRSHAG